MKAVQQHPTPGYPAKQKKRGEGEIEVKALSGAQGEGGTQRKGVGRDEREISGNKIAEANQDRSASRGGRVRQAAKG